MGSPTRGFAFPFPIWLVPGSFLKIISGGIYEARIPPPPDVCMYMHTHFACANDLLLFAWANESTITLIANCIHDFGSTAGLQPNLNKLNIYLAGVTDKIKYRLLEMTGFQLGSVPFRYLGILLAAKKLCTSNYRALTETIMRRLVSWPKHTLSYAGKLELVKTVLQEVECF